jgi:hypothetical protein
LLVLQKSGLYGALAEVSNFKRAHKNTFFPNANYRNRRPTNLNL